MLILGIIFIAGATILYLIADKIFLVDGNIDLSHGIAVFGTILLIIGIGILCLIQN